MFPRVDHSHCILCIRRVQKSTVLLLCRIRVSLSWLLWVRYTTHECFHIYWKAPRCLLPVLTPRLYWTSSPVSQVHLLPLILSFSMISICFAIVHVVSLTHPLHFVEFSIFLFFAEFMFKYTKLTHFLFISIFFAVSINY